MKILLVFLVFSVAFVHCEPLYRRQSAAENERFVNIFGALTSVVHQLGESVKNALNALKAQTESWIQKAILDLTNSVENAINAFVKQAHDELNAIINGQIKPCLGDVPDKVKIAIEETHLAIRVCHKNGWSKLSSIQEDINNYKNTNQKAVEGVIASIHSCVEEPDFGEKIKCAVDAARQISGALVVIRENIASTSTLVSTKIQEAVAEAYMCETMEIQTGQQKTESIFEDARKCIEDSGTTTEGPQTSGVTDSTTENQQTSEVTDSTADDNQTSGVTDSTAEGPQTN